MMSLLLLEIQGTVDLEITIVRFGLFFLLYGKLSNGFQSFLSVCLFLEKFHKFPHLYFIK